MQVLSRHVWLFAILVALGTPNSQASAQPKGELNRIIEDEKEPEAEPRRMRVFSVVPYAIEDAAVEEAVRLASAGSFARAAGALAGSETMPATSKLFLKAYYLQRAGRSQQAARLFAKVAVANSVLAPFASFRLGAMQVQAGKGTAAVGHFVSAMAEPTLRAEAGSMLADLFERAGNVDRTIQAVEAALPWLRKGADRRAMLLRYSFLLFTNARETEARWVLNDLYMASSKPHRAVEDRVRFHYGEGFEELRVLALLHQGSRSSLRRRLAQVEKSAVPLPYEQSMLRGALARLARRNRELALQHFEDASNAAKTREGLEAALYFRGRTLESLDRDLEARDMYDTLLNNREFPLFRPLLVRQASICIREGVPGDGVAYLERLFSSSYVGEDLSEAYWKAGVIHYLAQRWADAEVPWAQLQYHHYYDERAAWEFYGPMARYWRTRALQESGRVDLAVQLFLEQATNQTGYYALQALNRAGEAGYQLHAAAPANYETSPLALPDTLLLPAEFAASAEFFRLGIWQLAFDTARGRLPSAISSGQAAAFMASAWKRANPRGGWRSYRRMMADLPRTSDNGARMWASSFPIDYLPLILKAAKRSGLGPHIIAAIVRFESNFNPKVASSAGAIGLLQVKRNTGSDVSIHCLGKGRVNRRTLRDPETNLLLGAIYVAALFKRHHNDWAIALAAYNAGPGTAKWWLSRFEKLDADEIIEQFTYPNTVGYVKRVTAAAPLYWSLFYPFMGAESPDVHLPTVVPDKLNPFLDEVGGSCYSSP